MTQKEILFRFDTPRPKQEKLIQDAYEALSKGKIFLAHAETGLGKTDAALSAALFIAQNTNPKKTILFLTPKNAQHAIALEVVRGLNTKFGMKLKAIDLVGKKHVCIEKDVSKKEGKQFYEMCARKKQMELCEHYQHSRGHTISGKQKAKLAQKEIESRLNNVHSTHEIKKESTEFKLGLNNFSLCPYETSIDLSKNADVIIADYYHVFSPNVAETILPKIGKKLENCILIVDEAHNLGERIRSLLSTTLSAGQLIKAKEEALFLEEKQLAEEMETLQKSMEEIPFEKEKILQKKEWEKKFKEKIASLEDLGLFATLKGVEYLQKSGKDSSQLIHAGEFIEKWEKEIMEGQTRIIRKKEYYESVSISIKALDPSIITQNVFQKTSGCILMSGTLSPLEMHADILGVPKEKLEYGFYPTPFPKENRLNLIVPTVTTQYTQRNEKEFDKIALEASQIASQIPGNTVVFFPSFKLLETIGSRMKEKISKPILEQKEKMKLNETKELLDKFKSHSQLFGSVLLACTSGSFGEGIDLPGNELLGVIIVGVPLAEMNLEIKALIEYYQKKMGKGWEYGYLYPAMIKAVQASGRVIRSSEDKGVIALLDKRYTWENYHCCLPATQEFIISDNPSPKIKEFWEKQNKKE